MYKVKSDYFVAVVVGVDESSVHTFVIGDVEWGSGVFGPVDKDASDR